ncbi:MAG TPA: response regulator [Candidatus Gastranaerophilaceae bacterium]|nr:response regulator [Candidatus Gastranaerophilaceae bacterium]HPT41778.1 response regulator [Candidatus Gastranaerophilaceae bacterium]
MVDKITIELDEQFLKKFFGLTEKFIPEDQEITLLMLRKQLEEIEEAIFNAKMTSSAAAAAPAYQKPSGPQAPTNVDAFGEEIHNGDEFNVPKKSILIIDDLGVITYQLSVLFRNMGYYVVDSKEIYDAIEKFKKNNFDLVIMDLFIPTEREGFILLEELKKTSLSKQKQARIGIMSASAKKEHKQICKMKGAEFYVEKVDDWQKELINVIQNLS